MYAQTLVLSTSFLPYKTVEWKEAVTDMCLGKVYVIRDYPEILAEIGREAMKQFPELRNAISQVLSTDAEVLTIRVPAVVVLKKPVEYRKGSVRFSKFNVAVRDNFTCQYCAEKLPLSQLTKEHIVPQAQGGKTTWENVVMACSPCNNVKDNRTPEEAGMKLINGPGHVRRPASLPVVRLRLDRKSVPDEWVEFVN